MPQDLHFFNLHGLLECYLYLELWWFNWLYKYSIGEKRKNANENFTKQKSSPKAAREGSVFGVCLLQYNTYSNRAINNNWNLHDCV
jgi:hypothetical protein